jgi:hypothetical protein
MESKSSRPYDWTWASTKKPWWSEAWVWPVALLLTAFGAGFVVWMAISPALPTGAPRSTIVTQYFDLSEIQANLIRFGRWYIARPGRVLVGSSVLYKAAKLLEPN